MKKVGILIAATAALTGPSAFGSLLLSSGFEVSGGAPNAAAADSNMPLTAATQNPWYGARSGGEAYSSSTNTFSGSGPARNRIGSGGDTAHSGSQYAYAYSTGSTFGYVAQNITGMTVVPGDTYNASAYFLSKAATGGDGDRLQGGSADSINLIFLNSAGATISTVSSGTIIDSSSPYNAWTQGGISSVVAPVGTVSIEFQAYLTRGSAGGVMFVDDADLEDVTANAAVPEPTSLGLVTAAGLLIKRRRR